MIREISALCHFSRGLVKQAGWTPENSQHACRSVHCTAQLDPDNASILVCGGGGVALEVTRKLKDMGSWVWMLQRSENRRFGSCQLLTIFTRSWRDIQELCKRCLSVSAAGAFPLPLGQSLHRRVREMKRESGSCDSKAMHCSMQGRDRGHDGNCGEG